jgi:dTDP-4-dehydrorhamnose reductase
VDLGQMTVDLLRAGAAGLFHTVNSGESTWFGLASEAIRLAGPTLGACQVLPIPTSEYPTRAIRPPHSVLDVSELARVTGRRPRHWKEALAEYVASQVSAPQN